MTNCYICEQGTLEECSIGGGLISSKCSECRSIVTNQSQAKHNRVVGISEGYVKDYVDTTELQLTSLIAFANGMGYDEVYSPDGSLLRFKNEKNRKFGQEYVGISRMIKLHNQAAEDTWSYLTTVDVDFQTFINDDVGYDAIVLLFAGTCKIVQQVKGQYKRGVGFYAQDQKSSHMVKFMSERDYMQYRHWVGE